MIPSVAYIGPKSRTERPRKTKIGREVARVTCDTTFKVKRSKVNLQWRGHIMGPPAQLVIIKLSKPSKNENRKWVVFLFAICETGIGNRKTVVFLFPISLL